VPWPKLLRIAVPETGPAAVAKQVIRKVDKDDLGILAAALAYRFFLALFPFFIFIAALAGFVTHFFSIENPTDRIINTIGDTLPSDVTSVLRTQLESVVNHRNAALLSVGLVGTLWAASAGVGSLMRAMNRAYGVEETRPAWKRYALATGLTAFAGLTLVAVFLAFVVWLTSGARIADKMGLGGAAAALFPLLHWPVSVLAILLATAIIYRVAPNARLPFRRILPGMALFTSVWLIATYLFGLFVAHFDSYNSTYGTLGGVVILLVWFYLTAFILLVGAELNAVLEQRGTSPPRQ